MPKEYSVPFNAAWVREMMKLPKRTIIELLATNVKEADDYRSKINFLTTLLHSRCNSKACAMYRLNPETNECRHVTDCLVPNTVNKRG